VTDPREIARRARAVADEAAAAGAEPRYGDPATPLPQGEPRGLRDPVAGFRESGAADPHRLATGLVLAGGGAKGAYQAGALRYLAEANVQVVAVAGASVGALNGALVAAAPSLRAAADVVAEVWDEISADAGAPAHGSGVLVEEGTWTMLRNLPGRLRGPMLRRDYLDGMIQRYLDPVALRDGLPFFVSVFPASDPAQISLDQWDLVRQQDWDGPSRGFPGRRFTWVADLLMSWAGAESHVLYVNDMPRKRMFNAILSSAAIPVGMPPRHVDGIPYRDGGLLGGGNTPADALAGEFDRLIVIHLDTTPLFAAARYRAADVIEVIPSRQIAPRGPLGTMVSAPLDLAPAQVRSLAELGYEDTRNALEAARGQHLADQLGGFLSDRRADAVRELDEPL
jgi:NTE family protein